MSKTIKIEDRAPIEVFIGSIVRGPVGPMRMDDTVIGRILRSANAPKDVYAIGPNNKTVKITLDNYYKTEEELFNAQAKDEAKMLELEAKAKAEALRKSLEAKKNSEAKVVEEDTTEKEVSKIETEANQDNKVVEENDKEIISNTDEKAAVAETSKNENKATESSKNYNNYNRNNYTYNKNKNKK